MKGKPAWLSTLGLKVDTLFERKEGLFLSVTIIIALFFSLLYFNVGINTGGDDAGYILRAMRLWKNGDFPSFQGEIYPIFLSPFYGLSNGSLIFLRALSIPMFLGSIYFIFRTFSKEFRAHYFLILLAMLSVNYYWLSYASLTYSEALFNLIQYGILFLFSSRCKEGNSSWKDIFILSLLSLILLKTRSIGAAMYVALFIFFLAEKRWKVLLRFSLFSLATLFLYEILVYLISHQSGSLIISQLAGLLKENPYDVSQGSADIKILLHRLVFNFNEYLSIHVLQILGLRGTGTIEASWIYTALISVFALLAGMLNRSRSKLLRFVLIYLGVGFLAVLLTPEMWSQARFIQVFIPLILIVVVYELQLFAQRKYALVSTGILILLFIFQLTQSVHYAGSNMDNIRAFFKGDRYYENTPDWKNYFAACEWVRDNTDPEEGRVACRKPQIAALVSGQDRFYGIYNVPGISCFEIKDLLQEKDRNFLAIDMEKFFEYPVPQAVADELQKSFSGGIMQQAGNTNYRLFSFSNEGMYNRIVEVNEKLGFLLPMGSLISENNSYSVAFADSLLRRLELENVKYLLLANLRAYENERTEEVLSGVHNYKKTIEMKYPGIFEEVFNVGEESQEPATVYKINYTQKGKIRRSPEPDAEVPAGSDPYSAMCEWTLKNTMGNIICSGMGPYDIKPSGRFFALNDVPFMRYREFASVYKAGSKFLVIDPVGFDVKKIDEQLVAALLNSFYGFMYIGDHMYRLHQPDSPEILNRIMKDSYVSGFIFSYEKLLHLSEAEKAALYVVEPTYMLSEMRKRNVHYVMEDNLVKDNNRNIPRKLVFLISRKYPAAFTKVREEGSSEENRVVLYKVNYN